MNSVDKNVFQSLYSYNTMMDFSKHCLLYLNQLLVLQIVMFNKVKHQSELVFLWCYGHACVKKTGFELDKVTVLLDNILKNLGFDFPFLKRMSNMIIFL